MAIALVPNTWKKDLEIAEYAIETDTITPLETVDFDAESDLELDRLPPKKSIGPCLLIQHADAKGVASVTVTIECGALDTPLEVMGIPHLCEHLVWGGSLNFPEPDGFSRFIHQNGGTCNAETTDTRTTYYFSVNTDELPEAVARLADAILHPILSLKVGGPCNASIPFFAQTMRTEIAAIDAEWAGSKCFESRCHTLLKRLGREGHPWTCNFSCGNASTLAAGDPDTVLNLVSAFHSKYYFGRSHNIVIVDSRTIPALAELVKANFAEWTLQPLIERPYEVRPPAYHKEHLPQLVEIFSTERRLDCRFLTPEVDEYRWTRPLALIGFLLNEEHDGSLRSVLVEKDLIRGLRAMTGYHGFGQCFFDVEMMPTEKGTTDEGRNLVLSTLFSYVRLLINNPLLVEVKLDELSLAQDNRLRQMPVPSAINLATSTSKALLIYPPQSVFIAARRIMKKSVQNAIYIMENFFSPHSMFIVISKDDLEGLDLMEPFFKTEYNTLHLPANLWTPNTPDNLGLLPPLPNEMIPTNFQVSRRDSIFDRSRGGPVEVEDADLPEQIMLLVHRDSDLSVAVNAATLRFFLKTIAYADTELVSYYRCGSGVSRKIGPSFVTSGPVTRATVTAVLVYSIDLALRSVASQYEVAGTGYSMRVTSAAADGEVTLELSVSGHEDLACEMFKTVFSSFISCGVTLSDIESAMNTMREALRSRESTSTPQATARRLLNLVLVPSVISAAQCLAVLDSLTASELMDLLPKREDGSSNMAALFENCRVVAVVGGPGSALEATVARWIRRAVLDTLAEHNIKIEESLGSTEGTHEERDGTGAPRSAILNLDLAWQMILEDQLLEKGAANDLMELLHHSGRSSNGSVIFISSQITENCTLHAANVSIPLGHALGAKDIAYATLMQDLLSQRFSEALRSEKEIGYYLYLRLEDVGDELLMSLSVESEIPAWQLLSSLIEFLQTAAEIHLDEAEIKLRATNLAESYRRKRRGLYDKHSHVAQEVFSHRYGTDYGAAIARTLDDTRSLLKNFKPYIKTTIVKSAWLATLVMPQHVSSTKLTLPWKARSDWILLKDPRALHRILFPHQFNDAFNRLPSSGTYNRRR